MSWVTLFLFLFSITPKRYLHNLFAKHEDVVLKVSADDREHLCKSGFQCDCDRLVSTSPFVDDNHVLEFIPLIYFGKPDTFVVISQYSSTPSLTGLRGPPAIG